MINIKNLDKYFGTFHVLKNCNTTIDKGSVVVICGPSGSGKSTLIKCINGLEEFNSGEIAAISEYIQEFGDPDPWMDKVSSYVASREEVTTAEVLTNALDLDPRQQGRRESRRVADVLQSMGWRRLVTSRKDKTTGKSKSVRIWQRPKDDPLPADHILNDF